MFLWWNKKYYPQIIHLSFLTGAQPVGFKKIKYFSTNHPSAIGSFCFYSRLRHIHWIFKKSILVLSTHPPLHYFVVGTNSETFYYLKIIKRQIIKVIPLQMPAWLTITKFTFNDTCQLNYKQFQQRSPYQPKTRRVNWSSDKEWCQKYNYCDFNCND